MGLLTPEQIDGLTGYRLYTTQQLFRLRHIQSMRQVGLSIDEIRLVLSKQHSAEILEKRRTSLLEELTQRQDQLSRIEFMLQYKEALPMNYVATIKEIPACIVYSKRFTDPGMMPFLS